MLQYRCDDQGGPQPPKPWTSEEKKPVDDKKTEGQEQKPKD